MENRKVIPYSVELDITELTQKAKADRQQELDELNKRRQQNLEDIIPYVAQLLHYLTEVGNNFRDDQNLNPKEVIKQWTQPYHFSNNNSCWELGDVYVKKFVDYPQYGGGSKLQLWLAREKNYAHFGNEEEDYTAHHSFDNYHGKYATIEEIINQAVKYSAKIHNKDKNR